jgi:predicted MFS family arabinose efflux permease
MGLAPAPSAESEWRRGWSLVLAAAIGYGATTVHVYSIGALVRPLHASFGWTRGEITGPMMFLGVSGVLINPLVGRLVDQVGARRVGLAAVWAYAASLALIGLSGPRLWTWYLSWALLAALCPFVSLIVWTMPVVDSFRRYRGLVLLRHKLRR